MFLGSYILFWNVMLIVTVAPSVTLGLEDGWLVNISNNIYGMSWNQAKKYLDKNSTDFRFMEEQFCGQIDATFRKNPVEENIIKERYVKCFIQEFRQSNRHVEAPVSFTYSLVFNGTDQVAKTNLDALIMDNGETFVIDKVVWILTGDMLVNRYDINFVRVNISHYLIEDKPPSSVQAVRFGFKIEKFIRPINSPQDQLEVERQTCATLREYITDSIGCEVISMIQNNATGTGRMNVIVLFSTDINVTHKKAMLALGKLIELSSRDVVNNKIVINLGSLFVDEESITTKVDSPTNVDTNTAVRFEFNIEKFIRPINSPYDQLEVERQTCATLREYITDSIGCEVLSMTQNNATGTGSMNVIVLFSRDINVTHKKAMLALGKLIELSSRYVVNNRIVINLGSLFVDEESITTKVDSPINVDTNTAVRFEFDIEKFTRPINSPQDQLEVERQTCATLREYITNSIGCEVLSITQNNANGTGNMSVNVLFSRNINVTRNTTILALDKLMELSPRGVVNSKFVINIGPLFVDEDSLVRKIDSQINNVTMDTKTENVCINDTMTLQADPGNNTAFIVCEKGIPWRFSCPEKMTFDPSKKQCTDAA